MKLQALIEFASKQAETIFNKTGVIYPLYHAIKSHGERMVFSPPLVIDDKDVMVAMVKTFLAEHEVESYVFMDEAWTVEIKDKKLRPSEVQRLMRAGAAHHQDRREVVMFSAENRKGEMLTASRYILRPEISKPRLSPLKISDMSNCTSSGRMVGLLSH